LLVVLGVTAAAGCGPSFQAVYECDVRFEHCYAVDMAPGGVDVKKECWRVWLHDYTYGQSSDRIEYAGTRFSELSLDPTLPTIDTQARPRRRSAASPMPTSAFAPPPNVAESKTATAPSGSSSPPAPEPIVAAVAPVDARAPGDECTSRCVESWTSCHKGCRDGACDGCDRTYRGCVPACFPESRQPPRSLR
jgi:hypothetical protein